MTAPDVQVGDTVKTERGRQFIVRRVVEVDPALSQGASYCYMGRHGQSALSVAIVSVIRTIWRRRVR